MTGRPSSSEGTDGESKNDSGPKLESSFVTLNKRRRNWILFFPIYFMVRRLLFAITVVLFPQQIFMQLAAHFASGVTMIIYLG